MLQNTVHLLPRNIATGAWAQLISSEAEYVPDNRSKYTKTILSFTDPRAQDSALFPVTALMDNLGDTGTNQDINQLSVTS